MILMIDTRQVESLPEVISRLNALEQSVDIPPEISSRLDTLEQKVDTLLSYFESGAAKKSLTTYSIPTSRKISDTKDRKAIWYED